MYKGKGIVRFGSKEVSIKEDMRQGCSLPHSYLYEQNACRKGVCGDVVNLRFPGDTDLITKSE